jgi:hypothetical protein
MGNAHRADWHNKMTNHDGGELTAKIREHKRT